MAKESVQDIELEESDQQPFTEYSKLYRKKVEIEERMERIKQDCIQVFSHLKVPQVKGMLGTFSIKKEGKWKYSQTLEEKAKEIDDAKDEERKNGTAVFDEKGFGMQYRAPK